MWESGSFEINGVKYKYEAKVYDVGSKYGINNGRISKLKVVNDIGPNSWTWDNTVINYDRGWISDRKRNWTRWLCSIF